MDKPQSPSALLRMAMVVLVMVIAALYFLPRENQRAPVTESGLLVDAVQPRFAVTRIPLQLEGIVQAADQVSLLAEVSGTVIARPEHVRSGALVNIDDPVVQIDPQHYQLALAERQREVKAAALHLADTEAKARVARRVNGNKGSAFARLVPHLQEAQARLTAAKAGLQRAELDLARTRINAPFAGRLDSVNVSVGQFVRVGEVLATLSSTQRMEVRLPVRDEWLALIDFPLGGNNASPDATGTTPHDATDTAPTLTLKGSFAGREGSWPARLVRREGGVNRNRMVYLIAEVSDAAAGPLPLEPGVLVRTRIAGRPMPRIAELPRSVLAGADAVWLIDADNRLRRRPVTVVHRDRESVYISGGISEQDRLLLQGGMRWLEGALVQPRDQALTLSLGAR